MEKEFYCNTQIRVKEKNSKVEGYFGRGVAALLHGIETHQSLNLSAKQMGMAYSKAWRIMRQAEEVLGIQLLYRMGKKGSRLTPEGERFLAVYDEAEGKASQVVNEIFRKHYQENLERD